MAESHSMAITLNGLLSGQTWEGVWKYAAVEEDGNDFLYTFRGPNEASTGAAAVPPVGLEGSRDGEVVGLPPDVTPGGVIERSEAFSGAGPGAPKDLPAELVDLHGGRWRGSFELPRKKKRPLLVQEQFCLRFDWRPAGSYLCDLFKPGTLAKLGGSAAVQAPRASAPAAGPAAGPGNAPAAGRVQREGGDGGPSQASGGSATVPLPVKAAEGAGAPVEAAPAASSPPAEGDAAVSGAPGPTPAAAAAPSEAPAGVPLELHVHGEGRNSYGAFLIEGTYDTDRRRLSCRRVYVKQPRRAGTAKRRAASVSYSDASEGMRTRIKSGAVRWSMDLAEKRVADAIGLLGDDDSDAPKRPRKRKLSSAAADADAAPRRRSSSAGEGGQARAARRKIGSFWECSRRSRPAASGALWMRVEGHEPRSGVAFDVYEGGMVEGKRDGSGVCAFVDRSFYAGGWRMGTPCGRGIFHQSRTREVMLGDFSEGRLHGMGAHVMMSGAAYAGEWRENTRHGWGRYECANGGTFYEGEWEKNRRSGRGVFHWPDGSVYFGDWLRGARHGRGVLICKDGFIYDGQWANDVMEGRGLAIYGDGLRYEGMWRQGKRDGRGTLVFLNGVSYEGRFRDDEIQGQGICKMHQAVPGADEGEWLIPLQFRSDLGHIHQTAGFTAEGL